MNGKEKKDRKKKRNNPFWEEISEHMSKWLDVAVPGSPRLGLLGNQSEVPNTVYLNMRGQF